MTLAAVGRLLPGTAGKTSVTRERVRQIEITAIRNCRAAFIAAGITSAGDAAP